MAARAAVSTTPRGEYATINRNCRFPSLINRGRWPHISSSAPFFFLCSSSLAHSALRRSAEHIAGSASTPRRRQGHHHRSKTTAPPPQHRKLRATASHFPFSGEVPSLFLVLFLVFFPQVLVFFLVTFLSFALGFLHTTRYFDSLLAFLPMLPYDPVAVLRPMHVFPLSTELFLQLSWMLPISHRDAA